MFCGLPHEEEGQDVTGEDGGALPVPGGIGTGCLLYTSDAADDLRRPGKAVAAARWEDRAGLCIAGEVQSVAKGRGLSRFFFLTDLNTER